MHVFVFEHVCGGGEAGESLPGSLVMQGGAMLRAAATDLVKAGHEVSVLLDERLPWSISGVGVSLVSTRQELQENFDARARDADVTLVIAPECDGLLVKYLRRLAELGCRTLNASAEAAEVCADKAACFKQMRAGGVPTPHTEIYTGRGWQPTTDFPQTDEYVIKPRLGVGCEHTSVTAANLPRSDWPSTPDAVIQPRVAGTSASASLLVRDRQVTPLLAGVQHIIEDRDASGLVTLYYEGNTVPLPDAVTTQRVFDLSAAAIRTVPGLRGFVGVDVILGETADFDVVVEINSRLTMSYIACSRLSRVPMGNVLAHGELARPNWRGGSIEVTREGIVRVKDLTA